MAREGSWSVFDSQRPVVELKSQMPPWAAPRIRWPFCRMASAPIRPLLACSVPVLPATCSVGFGPSPVQALAKLEPVAATSLVALAALPETVLKFEPDGNGSYRVTMPVLARAADYLAWSDGLEPQFALIRQALKRPSSQMHGFYDGQTAGFDLRLAIAPFTIFK